MVFQLPAFSPDSFEFAFPGEKKKYRLPLVQDLPLDIRQQMSKAMVVAERVQKLAQRGRDYQPTTEDVEIMTNAQSAILERYAPGITSKISEAQFAALMEAWRDASQIDAGESQAS